MAAIHITQITAKTVLALMRGFSGCIITIYLQERQKYGTEIKSCVFYSTVQSCKRCRMTLILLMSQYINNRSAHPDKRATTVHRCILNKRCSSDVMVVYFPINLDARLYTAIFPVSLRSQLSGRITKLQENERT